MYGISPPTAGSPPKEPVKFDHHKPAPRPKLANLNFSPLQPVHNTVVPTSPPTATSSSKQPSKVLSPRGGEQKVKSVANLIETLSGKEQPSPGNEVSRLRSHTQVTRPPSLDPEHTQFQQANQKLAQFSALWEKNSQLIDRQKSNLIGNEHAQELSKLALREFTKSPSVLEEWLQLRQLIDKILNDKEAPEAPFFKLKELDLEKYFQWPNQATVLNIHSSTSKTFKVELKPNQKTMHDFLMNFLLEPNVEHPLKNRVNTKKIDLYTDSTPTTPTPTRLFNYLISLTLIVELLKIAPQELLNKESKEPIFLAIQSLIKNLKNLKEVRDLEEQGQALVESYCYRAGELLQEYVKLLAIVLRNHILQNEEGTPFRAFLSPNLQELLKSYFKTPDPTFDADFKRLTVSQSLMITHENTSLPPPELTEQTGKDKKALDEYSTSLLKFFMHYLQLNEVDQLKLQVHFNSYSSLVDFYNNILKNHSTKPEIIHRLLAIFNVMNQALLLKTNTSILSLEKLILNQSDVYHYKLIRDYLSPSSDQLSPYQKLDKDTKFTHFHFTENLLTITLKRVGALDNLPSQPPNITEFTKCFYPNCEITSTTTLTVNLPQMDNPTAHTEVEIKRPPYTIDLGLPFLRRYAALITALETMGINYHVV